ncbi:MAG: TolC family protein [Acidobacteria bacterium]|jgi:outer membrane protein TolC|nr:TolC family protein [Acidobacteriota bacterium]
MKKWVCFMMGILIISAFLTAAEELKEEQKKELSLKEAIYYTLKNNLDLQIQMTNEVYARKTLKINKAIFIPTLGINARTSESNNPSEGVLSGAKDVSTNQTKSLEVNLTQQLPLGGYINLDIYSQKSESNSIFSNPNPSLYAQAQVTLNQPLLKNFGLTPTKQAIYIAANNLDIARHQLKEDILNLVYSVEDAYWNLVYAYQNLETTKMALQRSRDFMKQNEIKVRVGSAAPIEILTAKADVAMNESQLIVAEQTIQTAEEQLKRILNMSKENYTVVPTEKPDIKKVDVNFEQFISEGLANRPDIERAKLNLENTKIGVKYARNQALPELNLAAYYYTTGRGGDYIFYKPGKSPILPDFDPATDIERIERRTISQALDDVFKRLYKNFQVQLNFNMPLSFSQQKAQLAQAKIIMERAELNLKNVENTVYSEIKEAIKALEANVKLVEAYKIAVELQGERLKAEEKKLSVGLSTNFIVLDYQRQYADVQTQALRSVINYNLALARINRMLARTFTVYDINFTDFINK